MYVIYYCALLQVCYPCFVSRIVRDNHGDECELSPTMRTPPICGKNFIFVRNGYDRHVVMTLHSHAAY
jgi:hypothetical protein